MSLLIVVCCICGAEYDPRDLAIEYRSLDRKWWCTDETSCTARRARAEVLMDQVADQMRKQ